MYYFSTVDQLCALPPFETGNAGNPTDIRLVWGTLEQITPSFHDRVRIVQEFLRDIPHQTSVGADIAGGAGRWLPHLSISFEWFIHMDISREALRHAHHAHPSLNNILYVQNDLYADRQTIKDADVVFCLDTLLYSGEFVDRALAGIGRVLKPGGLLIADLPSLYHHRIADLIKWRRRAGVNRCFTVREARELLRSKGFGIEKESHFFQELPANINEWINRHSCPDLVNNLSTWFYFAARRL
ncbi:MAG: methyltransferase domain-containing protein [Syntrophales bacterium]